jgi:hypothetical protein
MVVVGEGALDRIAQHGDQPGVGNRVRHLLRDERMEEVVGAGLARDRRLVIRDRSPAPVRRRREVSPVPRQRTVPVDVEVVHPF